MAGTGSKVGKVGRPRKNGKGGVGGSVGKRGLEEGEVIMLGGGKAFKGNGKGGGELFEGLVEKEGGWENDVLVIKKREGGVGKDVVGGERSQEPIVISSGEESADVAMDLGRGKNTERKGLGDSKHAKEVEIKKERFWGGSGFGSLDEVMKKAEVKRARQEKKREEFIVWEDVEMDEEEESGLGLLEEWKLKKKREDRLGREERRKREREGEVQRGLERGMSREEVGTVRRDFEDWKDMIGRMCYVFEASREEAVGFGIDVSLRRMERMMMEGWEERDGRGKVQDGNKGRKSKDEEEEVRRVQRIEEKVPVEGGRSYEEVKVGVKVGMKTGDIKELERKKLIERELEKKKEEEKEKREILSLEVVLDSQMEGESDWNKSVWEEELGLEKDTVKEIKGRGDRVRVVVEKKDDLKKGMEVEKKVWMNLLKKEVKEVKRLDKWCGVVVPSVDFEKWQGKMGELKRTLEVNGKVELMKEPAWLLSVERARSLGLKWMGVVCHVARESERKRLMEEGLEWEGSEVKVKRLMDRKEVDWCTKCASFGHLWWACGKEKVVCSICAKEGHTGWQHRCGRCNVYRQKCMHYGKCAACGKGHTMKEAKEHNCEGVRLEMERVRSLFL